MKGRPLGARPDAITGISIDSRTIAPGRGVLRHHAATRFDGHDFVDAGAGARRGDRGRRRGAAVGARPDQRLADRRRRRARRRSAISAARRAARSSGADRRGHRQRRQDRHQGDAGARRSAPEGEVHYSPASFNNHWGVPLTLARMPADGPLRRLRDRHEPCRRDRAADQAGAAACGDRHHGRAGASRISSTASKDIARAKAEIFHGLVPGGARSSIATTRITRCCAKLARGGGRRRASSASAKHAEAEVRLDDGQAQAGTAPASPPTILGETVTYKLGAPGRHLVQNSLAVLAAVSLLGGDLASAALALGAMRAPKGRGERHRLALAGGGTATLIDESYNANPASMRAAIALLGQAEPGKAGPADRGPRRHAGARAGRRRSCMPGSPRTLVAARVDRVFLAGPLMRALHGRLARTRSGAAMPRPRRSSNRCSPRRSAGRRDHGQGVERQPHGAAGREPQGDASPPQADSDAAGRKSPDALPAQPVRRPNSRSSTSSATSPSAPAGRR